MHIRSRFMRVVSVLLIAAAPTLLFAGKVGNPSGSGDSISFQLSVSGHDSITMSVSDPAGDVHTFKYPAGKPVTFSLRQLPGNNVLDGYYTYRLEVTPKIPPGIQKQLDAARAAGDDRAGTKILKDAGISAASQDGSFLVENGSIVPLDRQEPDAANAKTSEPQNNAAATDTKLSGPLKRFDPQTQDQVIPDDLIVQGSECVGLDCVNNEAFGVDTIKMKENNTRLKYEDTSTAAGFATTDWQLTANDQPSGGLNRFIIEDLTAATQPMSIAGSAPTNAFYMDSTGRIGFRTSTPVLDLHVTTGNTPALRFEQTSSGGFTAQTWDVAGNEANFFVRDVTGGSRLPFRIRPGAPTSSIDISADGDVGVGTASPQELLHVFANENANTYLLIENPNSGADANATLRVQSDTPIFDIKSHASGRTISRFGKTLGGWVELQASGTGNGLIVGTVSNTPLVLGTNSTSRMEIAAAGGVTISGNLTVTGTKAFAQVDPADSSKALHYVALEGPEAGTYFRGTAKTVNGVVEIDLPGYFSRITESERMTVQLTPNGKWGQMYVASKSPEKLVIKVVEGTEDIEFDFLVQGVRKGYLDFQVERENTLPR